MQNSWRHRRACPCPHPTLPRLRGRVGWGQGTVPDYRDGRDIRAFTPVFDGLLPGHDQLRRLRVLLLLLIEVRNTMFLGLRPGR